MKLPCETVQDLLPLYHDSVCSQVSRQLIAAHLEGCQNCRQVLASIQEEIPLSPEEVNTAKGLISIQKGWKKSMALACIKAVAITALVFSILIGGFLALTQWNWLPVTTLGCSIGEIYRLQDGRILYRMDIPQDVWCRDFRFEHHDDGSDYIIPVRSLISLGQLQGIPSMWGDYHMIDPAENNAWQQSHGHGNAVTKWYWGQPGEAILIYQDGMALEPAPQVLEERFGSH